MRHADTSGRHLSAPYVGYVPGGIRVSYVESLPRRSVQAPYEGLVEQSGLRLMGCLAVAVCRYSWGYTRGVPILGGTYRFVILPRDGGYGEGLRLLL